MRLGALRRDHIENPSSDTGKGGGGQGQYGGNGGGGPGGLMIGSGASSASSRLNRDASLVKDTYSFLDEIGAGAFGRVVKAVRKQNGNSFSAAGSTGSGPTSLSKPGSGSSYNPNHHNNNNNNSNGASSSYASLNSLNGGGPSASEVFAVKHVDIRKAGASGLKSVISEVETLALLNHPYIVRLEEVFKDKDNLFIVMEFVPGGELASALKKLHRLHEAIARKITMCLLEALQYLHEQGIVHRDIKPANCLLTADGMAVKIADFGFAVMVGPTSCLTESCGTPAYIAPEVFLGENYGKAVDLWALGVMIYLMLTGEYPFVETERESLAEAVCRGRYSTSGKVWDSEISAGAKDFLSKLLNTDPSKRWTAMQCLNHNWIRVARSGGGHSALDGLYAQDDMDDSGSTLLASRAASGMAKLQHAIAGGPASSLPVAPTSRPKRGRHRLRIVFRGAVAAVRATLRLLFFIRLHALRREGLDGLPMLRGFSFVVTRRYVPPVPTVMNCRAICPGNARVLTMIVSIFEHCPTVENLDLSHNKIDSLDLVQIVCKAAMHHPNLTVLCLDGNPIPTLAARTLVRLARTHPKLRTLSVVGTSLGTDTLTQIATALKENDKKRHDAPTSSPSNAASGGGGFGDRTPQMNAMSPHVNPLPSFASSSPTPSQNNGSSGGTSPYPAAGNYPSTHHHPASLSGISNHSGGAFSPHTAALPGGGGGGGQNHSSSQQLPHSSSGQRLNSASTMSSSSMHPNQSSSSAMSSAAVSPLHPQHQHQQQQQNHPHYVSGAGGNIHTSSAASLPNNNSSSSSHHHRSATTSSANINRINASANSLMSSSNGSARAVGGIGLPASSSGASGGSSSSGGGGVGVGVRTASNSQASLAQRPPLASPSTVTRGTVGGGNNSSSGSGGGMMMNSVNSGTSAGFHLPPLGSAGVGHHSSGLMSSTASTGSAVGAVGSGRTGGGGVGSGSQQQSQQQQQYAAPQSPAASSSVEKSVPRYMAPLHSKSRGGPASTIRR